MKILEMLTYRRPAGSAGEEAFLERFVMPWKPARLPGGNLMVVVPGDPETIFSCHTDTVHRDDALQEVVYDAELELAYKEDKEPLGADDTAGVWLMLEMLEAGVPGTYLFHFGEERGCIGSKALAQDRPEWLRTFKRAIAFDRRDTDSVITHQMGWRCCSGAFALELAARLGGDYKPDDTGLYTDTASYADLIPECTNISVGYSAQHTPDEMLDIAHLEWLRDRVISIDWSTLPTKRDPDATSFKNWDDKDDEWLYSGLSASTWLADGDAVDYADTKIRGEDDALDLIVDSPDLAATIIVALLKERDILLDKLAGTWPEEAANEPVHSPS